MTERPTAYLSPKLEARYRPEIGGHGVFAVAPVQAGERLLVWSGVIYTGGELHSLTPQQRRQCLQVEEDLYLVTTRPGEPADYVNHCCDPNSGLDGQIVLRALRDIAAGEEICFDYATCDGSPYDEFDCRCGAANCRGRITGDDWRSPALWERYAGHFSPYLQRRIDRLKQRQPAANRNGPAAESATKEKSPWRR